MKGAVLYTQPGCGPCVALKSRLMRDGLPFEEVNVRESADGAALLQGLGYTGTPVLALFDSEGSLAFHSGFTSDVVDRLKAAA